MVDWVVNSDEESDTESDEYQDVPELSVAPASEDLQSHLRGANSDEESDDESDSEEETQPTKGSARAGDAVEESDSDDAMEEGRLFVRNLPYSCTEEEVSTFAKQFGEISDVFIPLTARRESRGYGFITFLFPEQALAAIEVGVWVCGEG